MRAPADLSIPRNGNSIVTYLANLLYMFEVTSKPAPDLVQRLMGGVPASDAFDFVALRFLLEQGFHLHSIHGFDRARFVAEGVAYLEEKYEELNPKKQRNWTFAGVAGSQDRCKHELEMLAGFGSSWTQDIRTPSLADIKQSVASGKVVSTVHGSPGHSWPLLVWGRRADTLLTYVSRPQGTSGLGTWDSYSWQPLNGVVVISRP